MALIGLLSVREPIIVLFFLLKNYLPDWPISCASPLFLPHHRHIDLPLFLLKNSLSSVFLCLSNISTSWPSYTTPIQRLYSRLGARQPLRCQSLNTITITITPLRQMTKARKDLERKIRRTHTLICGNAVPVGGTPGWTYT